MRILLVEDDRPLSDALALSLKNANYAVDCVYTGADAMTTLSIGQTDIVVLDLGLPDTDGLNVLKSIRKKNATLPVLILTARDKVSDKISGLDAGADDYLPKPFEIDSKNSFPAHYRGLFLRLTRNWCFYYALESS